MIPPLQMNEIWSWAAALDFSPNHSVQRVHVPPRTRPFLQDTGTANARKRLARQCISFGSICCSRTCTCAAADARHRSVQTRLAAVRRVSRVLAPSPVINSSRVSRSRIAPRPFVLSLSLSLSCPADGARLQTPYEYTNFDAKTTRRDESVHAAALAAGFVHAAALAGAG